VKLVFLLEQESMSITSCKCKVFRWIAFIEELN